MNIDIDYIVFFILSSLMLFMMQGYAFYKKHSEKYEMVVRKAVDTTMVAAMQICLYFLLISITGTIQNEENPIVGVIYTVLVALTSFKGATYLFRGFLSNIFQLTESGFKKSGWFWLILFDLFVLLLVAGAFLNYAFLILFPGGFQLENWPDNRYLAGFECIYYTFSLITTNGTPNISANHPAIKVLEMIEMLVFYLVYGCWLTNLMSND